MFETAEIGHAVDKATYKEQSAQLREALLEAQYELKQRADFPILILVHGLDTVGRDDTMNLINEWMDPRLIDNIAFTEPTKEERQRPWMWRYWNALPAKGRIGMYFGSYYDDAMRHYLNNGRNRDAFDKQIFDILRFEHMLTMDGAMILKFWFHVPKKKQRVRLKALESDPKTAWRVTPHDWKVLGMYDDVYRSGAHMMRLTNSTHSPWLVVEGEDANYRNLTVARALLYALRRYLDGKAPSTQVEEPPPLFTPIDNKVILDTLQLDQEMDKKTYQRKLTRLQARLNGLVRDKRFADHSLILAFEGNDAAGKGGSIRRVAQAFDVRHYRIVPIAAPTEEERAKPWLWRFWRRIPAKRGITIFDRTWYGRVLVERVENLTPEFDWRRGYHEINDFEHQLTDNGAIIVKFWLAISNDEQLKRFQAREETGFKRFKITDEDWRNRDKWDDYRLAVSDMIASTSSGRIPWTLVEANNKYFARIKVLQTICDRVEQALKFNSDKIRDDIS